MKALVVDDDLALADVVGFTLRRAGYEIIMAHDGETALSKWEQDKPDIIILDINLPKLDGLSVCKRIRASSSTPIIMLSVRGEEDDVVKGLQFGADDYVVKPFSPRQLVARAEAVLRRSDAKVVTASPIQAGDLSLDPLRNEVVRDGEVIAHLTKMECRLLELMMINQNQVLPFDTLIDAIWGPGGGDRMMLKQLIYRVRRKIELQPSQPFYLLTYAGTGYGFDPS